VSDGRYRFRSTWRLAAPPEAVWDALEDVPGYVRWWPDVRLVEIVELAAVSVTCRSVLPYSLTFVSRPARRDAAAGVLEARLSGDLDGWSRWTVSSDGVAVFEQSVTLGRPLLRVLSPVARPAFRANHWAMMRRGERGLRQWLSRGAASPPP